MAATLALFETGALTLVVGTLIGLSSPAPLAGLTEVGWLAGKALALALCCVVSFYYTDLYDWRIATDFTACRRRVVRAAAMALVLLWGFYVVFPEMALHGERLLSSLGVLGMLFALRTAFCGVLRTPVATRRVMIVGTSPLAYALADRLRSQPHLRHGVVMVDDGSPSTMPTGRYPLLGPLERLDKIIEEVRPDRIIVAPGGERRGRVAVRSLLESRARGIPVENGLDVYERLTGKIAIESLTPSALLFSRGFRATRLHRALGRGLSVCVAVVGLLALGVVIGLVALAIKADSRGPVFFVQERVGLHNVPFRLIKFRTMRPDAGETSEWVADNGHRITRVGKVLRKFRLDELPQFINVLRGDMNLVGPRPHPVSNFTLFMEHIPFYALRSAVRPGVTGWAQVRYGYANNLREETEKMRHDLYYVKHLSLWLDLRVLFDTVKVVLFGLGATAATDVVASSVDSTAARSAQGSIKHAA
ncbi:MAG TPA: sugar transferase [Candidatus Limnocylindria bacterium]|nr:sugar transferase [Candidatus Limnocylindria bacterium]